MSEHEGTQPAQPEQPAQPSLWRTLAMPVSLAVTVFALGFGILWATQLESGNAEATPTTTETSSGANGAAVFATAGCGGCHTLSAAQAAGAVGPNLDETKLSQQEIAQTVANGRPGTAMQAYKGTLTQAQIDAVAAYVSGSDSSSP
jgi:mono/diheme cytochrome c family protein